MRLSDITRVVNKTLYSPFLREIVVKIPSLI